MTVLVDTGVIYADHDIDASRHDVAAAALDVVYLSVGGLNPRTANSVKQR